jgi:hypothetical protein
MLHALFIAISTVGVVFFPICMYGFILYLRNNRDRIGDLAPQVRVAAQFSPRTPP